MVVVAVVVEVAAEPVNKARQLHPRTKVGAADRAHHNRTKTLRTARILSLRSMYALILTDFLLPLT